MLIANKYVANICFVYFWQSQPAMVLNTVFVVKQTPI